MLFGVVPGLGAHVENGAIVENEYCESQRKLGSTIVSQHREHCGKG